MNTDVYTLADLTRQVVESVRPVGCFIQQERAVFDASRVEEKNLHDYVSYVDREAERRLVASLSELLPGSGFITEEATAACAGEPYLWIVDPLDGTTNFVHDHAPYVVSVALYAPAEGLLAGVVYDPRCNECFYAWKGGGAYLDGVPLSVSSTDSIGKAYLHLGLPYDAVKYGQLSAVLLSRFYGRVGAVRIAGSAAMDICDVAAGRCDAYIEPSLHVWDVAAGILILHEAGGAITDFSGVSWLDRLASGGVPAENHYDVVAATSPLHAEVLAGVCDCL